MLFIAYHYDDKKAVFGHNIRKKQTDISSLKKILKIIIEKTHCLHSNKSH